MSRIGKKLIPIVSGVNVLVEDGFVKVKGPKGSDSIKLNPRVFIEQNNGSLLVSVKNPNSKDDKALWGLFRMLIANMISGVQRPYEKKLEMVGVGYKAAIKDKKLVLEVGFSHSVEIILPDGIECLVEKNIITVIGISKQLVGEIAAQIRAIRKPEPYKGKGIRYVGEVVRRKEGKAAKTAGAAA